MPRAEALTAALSAQGLPIRQAWASEWLRERGPCPAADARAEETQLAAAFLCADLCVAGIPQLPRDMASWHRRRLAGVYLLQLLQAVDVSQPHKQRNSVHPSKHRCLKLALTDGHVVVAAIEYKRITQLKEETLGLGAKFLVYGQPEVCRGLLFLQEDNVKVVWAGHPLPRGDPENVSAAQALTAPGLPQSAATPRPQSALPRGPLGPPAAAAVEVRGPGPPGPPQRGPLTAAAAQGVTPTREGRDALLSAWQGGPPGGQQGPPGEQQKPPMNRQGAPRREQLAHLTERQGAPPAGAATASTPGPYFEARRGAHAAWQEPSRPWQGPQATAAWGAEPSGDQGPPSGAPQVPPPYQHAYAAYDSSLLIDLEDIADAFEQDSSSMYTSPPQCPPAMHAGGPPMQGPLRDPAEAARAAGSCPAAFTLPGAAASFQKGEPSLFSSAGHEAPAGAARQEQQPTVESKSSPFWLFGAVLDAREGSKEGEEWQLLVTDGMRVFVAFAARNVGERMMQAVLQPTLFSPLTSVERLRSVQGHFLLELKEQLGGEQEVHILSFRANAPSEEITEKLEFLYTAITGKRD
ncbi:hypothetical protein Efla_007684 [Eimeria flavescens]